MFGTVQLRAQDSSFTFQENDFVTIGSNSSLQTETGMTIECWVNPELQNYSDFAPIVHYFRLGGPTEESGFTLLYFENELRFILSVGTGDYDIYGDGLGVWPGTTLDQDVWTHVAGIYDSATGQVKIFKNGVEQASFNTEGGNVNWEYIETVEMKIGKSNNNPGGSDGYFSGGIDEVRLWDTAFDQNTLQTVMCNSPIGSPGLIGYWNFNDGNDATITDLTGNGNDGTLTNSGSGYWDADVYGNNDICLGSGACVDSVIAALPFFHAATLDETMGDDWNFQNYPHGVDYAYELTLSTQRNLYIDTCDTLTNFDTIVSIKDACGNDVSIIESDDGTPDFCPEASVDPPYFASIIDSINLEAGTYYIVLDGFSGTTGNYAVAVGTLPSIVSSAIAEDDSYLEIRFSEGMFTEATGNGALETSDFEISFNQNGGTATGVDIDYMSNTSGSALEGGEDTVRFSIAVQGESTGLEQVMIRTQSNASIFNSFGIGLLRSASITQNLSDQIAPFLVSSNPDDGAINIATYSDITLEFSEPIQNADETNINNSNSENSILLKNANTGENLDYTITTSNNTNFNIFPDEDLPEYSYIQIILLSNIEDTNGNLFGNDTIQFQTADESPPQIQSSNLASTNEYVVIVFNESIYSTSSGSGGIEISDLNYTFESNGGNCESASILSLNNYTGALLTGGETTIHAFIQLDGSPSGTETIILSPADGSSIYDQAGNPMHPSSTTATLVFNASALILSQSLADSNEFVDVTFSSGVFGDAGQTEAVDISDIYIALTPNDGNATELSITNLSNTAGNGLSGGEETIRIHLSFNNLPSGVETILIRPSGETQIYNSAGVLVPESENTGQIVLFDQLPPGGDADAEDGAVDVDQGDSLSMTFTDDLYNPETGELATLSELAEFVTLRSGDSSGTDIPFDLIMEGSPPTLIVVPLDEYESEQDIYFSFNAVLADANGNTVEFSFEASFSIRDYVPPIVDSSALALDNTYIDLIFDEELYGNDDATGMIETSDINIIIISNGSNVDTCSITSLTLTDSNFLIGGETNVRVNLEYNNTPDGNELIVLEPSEGTTLFDESGNQFTSPSYTDTLQLNDILPPSIDTISIPIDSFIVLMESTPITFSFNEKVDSLEFTVAAVVADSVNFDSSRSDSSLDIILNPPFTSFDSITVNFSYLEDEAGLSTVDIAYTYVTPILGDYDLDSVINYSDLWDLVENWELKNYNYELGPVTGDAPHFVSFPDSKFDIEDGMAFVRMWSWYQKTYGQINEDTSQAGRPLNMAQNGNDLFIFLDDTITAGQFHISYEPGTTPVEFFQRPSKERELFINNHFPEKGFSILEFARTGLLKSDTLRMTLDESSEITLFYILTSNKNSVAQKGSAEINHTPLPTKVALYPAYPNPFNPITTLQFDVPNAEVIHSISLNIFDMRGRQVETLVNGSMLPGSYRIQWHADQFASGMYFAKLVYGTKIKTQKILLLK